MKTSLKISAKNKFLRTIFGLSGIVRTSIDSIRITIEDEACRFFGMDAAKGMLVEVVVKQTDTVKIERTIGESLGKDDQGEAIPENVLQIDPSEISEALKRGSPEDEASVSITTEDIIVKSGRITRRYRARSTLLIPSKWSAPDLPMTAAVVMKRNHFVELFSPLSDISMIRVRINNEEGMVVDAEEDNIVKGTTYLKLEEMVKYVCKEPAATLFGSDYFDGIAKYIPGDIETVTFKLAKGLPCYILFGDTRCILAPRIEDP